MELNLSLSEICKAIKHCKPSGHGIECNFFNLNDTIGIKLFDEKKARDSAYISQALCARYDLAPYVGRRFQLDCKLWWRELSYLNHCKYGYVTELADTECLRDDLNTHGQFYLANQTIVDQKVRFLTEELMRFNLGRDLHMGNLGYILRDNQYKLVPIDFGPACSQSGWENTEGHKAIQRDLRVQMRYA